MSEFTPPIDDFELLSKYLSGNASDEEVRHLEAWVLANPEHKAQFRAYKQAWMLSGIEKNSQNIDVEKEWADTVGQLFWETKVIDLPQKQQGRRRFLLLRIAAAIALLAVASIWLFRSAGSNSIEILAQNETLQKALPDGSQVSLNQFASLKFDAKMDGAIRKVELQGDAFFEVKRDTEHPFIIATQNMEIEVLGTSFYVDSRANQKEIQVIVKSGSVAVRAEGKQVVLKANESGIYKKSNKELVKKENQDANYIGWQNNTLAFEDADFEEVIFALNRHFHTNISLENRALSTCKITATFNDKTLIAIVRIIEKTLNIKSSKENGQIVFSGKGCEE